MDATLPNPVLLARRIAVLIEGARIDVSTEDAAHRGILDVLTGAGIEVESEVRLGARDRIDLLAGSVGIEIKVGHSRRSVLRQLERYAESERIEALVLATGAAWSRGTASKINGKPVFLASLAKGWL